MHRRGDNHGFSRGESYRRSAFVFNDAAAVRRYQAPNTASRNVLRTLKLPRLVEVEFVHDEAG